jgi:biopolymer transport protein ExbD
VPVKLGGKLPTETAEARIEIVPLIDIMFFLLASFMLISLSMVHANIIKVNLPVATTASPDAMRDVATVSIDKQGKAYLDKVPMADNELRRKLADDLAARPHLRVVISGDKEARNGAVIHILDLVRGAGIDKVGFDTCPPGPPTPPTLQAPRESSP